MRIYYCKFIINNNEFFHEHKILNLIIKMNKDNNDLIKFILPEFIHKDDRGMLKQITSKGKWSQVNYIESDIGSIRGNHYHKINRELFYIIDGKFMLTLELNDHKMVYEIIANDLFIIEPMVKHSFDFKEKTRLISMYDKGVELENGQMDILL
jgi:quercetin dioxygenase-like cupin family protein